ncbi:MAG TPA: hypothetical protein VFU37_22555 [Pyrinomonadaceae bacterium]|nr:hypothetical protein [Pyrinomonadaceae bacterium]
MKDFRSEQIIGLSMSEDTTKEFSNHGSFEQQVLARFDSMDKRLDTVDVHFDGINARLEKLESHSYQTKPIWERALKEIMETRLEVGEVNKKLATIDTRVGVLEGDVAGLKNDYGALNKELLETQRSFIVKLTRRIDLVLEVIVDTRNGMRDADERLTRLESKLA